MPIPRVLLCALMLGATAALVPTDAALADPTSGSVDSQIEQASNSLEDIVEEYNTVTEQVKSTQAAIVDLSSWMDVLRRRLEVARQAVDTFAAAAYRSSGMLSTASVMLAADSPDALLDRMTIVIVVSRRQQREISRYARLAAMNDANQRRLRQLLDGQTKQQHDLAARKKTIEASIRDLEALKQRLNVPAARPALSTSPPVSGSAPPPPAPRPAPPPSPAAPTAAPPKPTAPTHRPSPRPSAEATATHPPARPAGAAKGRTAVAFARAQLRKPYVYATAGPDSYDCSGLTMAAWAAAGVPLPHSASMQWDVVSHIPRSALRPGDLVFYRHLGHVAIYIGDGKIIHAPQTGDVVRIASVDRAPPYGFGRPG